MCGTDEVAWESDVATPQTNFRFFRINHAKPLGWRQIKTTQLSWARMSRDEPIARYSKARVAGFI